MLTSKTSILAEQANRIAEQVQTGSSKPHPLDPAFPKQSDFISDPARFVSAQCSRRAGKTNGLAIRFYNAMVKYPKSRSVYLGLTFESARDIMIPVFKELNESHGWGCTFLDSNNSATVRHPNGSQLKIMGADMKNFIKRLKGRKHPAIGIDEAQDFGVHLQSLIDDVLTPCIADYEDGWLALTGTPGPVPQGYFFEVTRNGRFGYSHHEWTILDNPHMPNPEGFIAELIKKREWEDNNPTLLREWRNKWVLDVASLWVRYKESLNHFDTLPEGHEWHYVMGVDLGFKDADAIAVIAWSETTPNAYLVEEYLMAKQGITELVDAVNALEAKYKPHKIVIDEGGLGKKIAEEIRRRHGISVEPADKARKQENVELLNDSLRLGTMFARKDSRFVQDSYLVQIDWAKSTPNKVVIKKDPHSDIIDAVLYAFKECYAFAYTPPEPELIPGTKEWAEAQEDGMFEDLQARLKGDDDW